MRAARCVPAARGGAAPAVARCRCRATPPQAQQQQAQAQQQQQQAQQQQQQQQDQYAYSDPVNAFLGRFLPQQQQQAQLAVHWDAPKLTGQSVEQMAALVEAGLERTQWFVTGEVDARLFSDNFAFKDDSVATSGIESYARGVRKLFDQDTAKAELVSVEARPDARSIVVVWRLEGRVNLPLKPRIKAYVVTTTLGLDSDGLICSQLDEFSVPGYDLLLSCLFGEGFGAPPAPPVEQLRQQAAARQRAG